MAVVTCVCSVAHAATRLGEDPELLEAIVNKDDNLTYGNIVSVHTGHENYTTTLTSDGIEELRDILANARVAIKAWHSFLDNFVDDPDIIAPVKNPPIRLKPGAFDSRLVDDDFHVGIRKCRDDVIEPVKGAVGTPYPIPEGASEHKYGALGYIGGSGPLHAGSSRAKAQKNPFFTLHLPGSRTDAGANDPRQAPAHARFG